MTLSSHIDIDYLEDEILQYAGKSRQPLIGKYLKAGQKYHDLRKESEPQSKIVARFSGIDDKYKLPQDGIDPDLAYQLVHSDLTLDGNTTLNLASFVNVHVEDSAHRLIEENLTKNLADNDEYPMLIELQDRCVSMLADLWHAPVETRGGDEKSAGKGKKSPPGGSEKFPEKGQSGLSGEAAPSQSTSSLAASSDEAPAVPPPSPTPRTRAIGTACTGSSEAVMLGGLAMKKNWQARRRKQGKDAYHPNILMASCCQVALEKFARYFDVEARIIPVSKSDFLINYDDIRSRLDENTIGIFVIVGSTYTGGFESVRQVNQILDDFEEETGNYVPIHVDGASGGMVAAIMYPELEWDFRIPRVQSINTSGHKFGLTTAGLGWVIFRTKEWLPEELKFQLQYLGGLEESFSLNFSRPGFQVVHQYYNFIRLGRQGYSDIFDNCLTNARILSFFLEETGYFKCISNLHLPVGVTARGGSAVAPTPVSHHGYLSDHSFFNPALPVVSFQLSKEFTDKYPEVPQSTISKMLRNKKWIVPNYSLPRTDLSKEGAKETDGNNQILRVVVKYDLESQLLDKLMHDIVDVVEILIESIKMVRTNVGELANDPENVEVIGERMVYNMLISLANDADRRLIKMKKGHDNHLHPSYRGTC
ncbi:DEKNAAC105267 [Brettanomyces naardenensis]|uniref:Glutamate decarboxylase n=1 Tax=Brettanomyces naardenensis TaxID=13370 RepID=A0A448YSU1_BRENA|nr:DEKNAAC105267 [Brettanomyces naardenensis]